MTPAPTPKEGTGESRYTEAYCKYCKRISRFTRRPDRSFWCDVCKGDLEIMNEERPNVDVPLKDQTRECLIAQVEAMDKQAKDNEKRRAALENVVAAARVINEWQPDWDEPKPFYEVELVEAIDELDALAPKEPS